MKFKLTILTILFVFSALVSAVTNYNVPQTSTVPVIDNTSSLSDWSDALTISLAWPISGGSSKPAPFVVPTDGSDYNCIVYLKWDINALYVAWSVTDNILVWDATPSTGLADADCMQFGVKPMNDSTYEPIWDFAPCTSASSDPNIYHRYGGTFGPYTISNATLGGYVGVNSYVMKLRIPWADLTLPGNASYIPLAGDKHGVCFVSSDYDDSSDKSLISDCGNGDFGSIWVRPYNYNTITLVANDNCGQNGRLQSDINGDCVVDLKDFAKLANSWLGQ